MAASGTPGSDWSAVARSTRRPSSLGDSKALVTETGLANPRRTVDAERLATRILQRPGEHVQLVAPAHERPASGDGHRR